MRSHEKKLRRLVRSLVKVLGGPGKCSVRVELEGACDLDNEGQWQLGGRADVNITGQPSGAIEGGTTSAHDRTVSYKFRILVSNFTGDVGEDDEGPAIN